MSDQPTRPWREVAAELIGEMKPDRIVSLYEELDLALEEQVKWPRKPAAGETEQANVPPIVLSKGAK
jgi:hypothetical protein